jgi:hypothetical protein
MELMCGFQAIAFNGPLSDPQLLRHGLQRDSMVDKRQHFNFTFRQDIQRAKIHQPGISRTIIKRCRALSRGSRALWSPRHDTRKLACDLLHRPNKCFRLLSTANWVQNYRLVSIDAPSNDRHRSAADSGPSTSSIVRPTGLNGLPY